MHQEHVCVCLCAWMCVCVYVSSVSAGRDGSSPSELRADSCWSDAVGSEEDINLPP